jgi:hypothetical protein
LLLPFWGAHKNQKKKKKERRRKQRENFKKKSWKKITKIY